jgi:hypothetical protein
MRRFEMDFWWTVLIALLIILILAFAVPFLIYLWSKAQMAGWISVFMERFSSRNDSQNDEFNEEERK